MIHKAIEEGHESMDEPDETRETWSYEGRVEMHPDGRGITLDGLSPGDPHRLDEAVPEGLYIARLVVESVSDQEHTFDPTAMAKLIDENHSATIKGLADR